MNFEYAGTKYDIFDIVDKENILMANDPDNDQGVTIILKHGIRQLCDYFNFKDNSSKILLCAETKDFGSLLVVELTMAKGGGGPATPTTFIGDGEVSGKNFQSKKAPYPYAVAVKRARSRAVLWELGLNAYGEDEAEGFQETVRKKYAANRSAKREQTFSKTNTSVQVPKAATSERPQPVPTTSTPAFKPAQKTDNTDEAQIKASITELKEFATKLGFSVHEVTNVLKSETCLNIKGMPNISHFKGNMGVFDEAKRILSEMAKTAS